jgi:tetratricopeptide (TPR) repeat protein
VWQKLRRRGLSSEDVARDTARRLYRPDGAKIEVLKNKRVLRAPCPRNQNARIYWPVKAVLWIGFFGIASTSAFPFLLGASLANAGYSLPTSCRALGSSSPEISVLIARATSQPSAGSYDSLGQFLAQRNQFPCAIAAYQLALNLDPGNWNTRYALATTLLRSGHSRRAITELQEVLRRQPDSFMVHNALGLAFEKLGNLDAAREEYENAVTQNPRFARGYYNLAHLASMKKRFAAAVFYANKSLALDPGQPRYQLALGIAYSEDGKFAQAVHVLQTLIASHPAFFEAYLDLGAAYGQEERFSEAVESYRQALRLDPRNCQAQLFLGIALWADTKPRDAVPVLKGYIVCKPRDPQGYYWLGRVYKDAGRYQDAARALEQASSLNGASYDIRYNLGVVLAHLGRDTAAADQLRIAEKLNARSAGVHYQLFRILQRLNDQNGSSEELKAFQTLKVRDVEKTQSIRYYNRGDQLLAAGKFQSAAEQYRRALDLNPDNARLHYNLSQALRGLGDDQGQEKELKNAIQLDPNLAPAYYRLAELYMKSGQVDRAEQALKTALIINPQFREAEMALTSLQQDSRIHTPLPSVQATAAASSSATVFRGPVPVPTPDLGSVDDAVRQQIEAAQAALQAVSQKPNVSREKLAKAYGQMGRVYQAYKLSDAGATCYRNAHLLAPSDYAWPYYLGRLYEDNGNINKAISNLEIARRLQPSTLWVLLSLGNAYLKDGQLDEAAALFQQALALDQSSAGAIAGLGNVALGRKDYATAVHYLQEALKLQPQATELHYPLAMAFRGAGDINSAIYQLRLRGSGTLNVNDPLMKSLDDIRTGEAASWRRGNRALLAGHYAEAAKFYNQMLKFAGGDPLPRIYLGNALAEMGNSRGAIEQYQQVLSVSPNNAAVHYDLGVVLFELKYDRQAIEQLNAALSIDPVFEQAHFQLANLLMKNRQYVQAISHYTRVIELSPDNGFARLMKSLALVRLGRYADAKAELEQSLAALPGNTDLALALARILAASPDQSLRDGSRALEITEKLLHADHSPGFELLETYAMALASAGKFHDATHLQQWMLAQVERAGRADLAAELERNLALYERGRICSKPWQDDDPIFTPQPGKMVLLGAKENVRVAKGVSISP